MNVGQILETHLAWACAGMGKKIGQMLEDYRKHLDITDLRKELTEIYESEAHDEVKHFDDDALVKLAKKPSVAFPSPPRSSTVRMKATSPRC